MRKFLCGFLLGSILFCAVGTFAVSYVATLADFKVFVNDEEFVSDSPALVVEGKTYLPLRAIGEALGVSVEWNEELRRAEIEKNSIEYGTTYDSEIIDFGITEKSNVSSIRPLEDGSYLWTYGTLTTVRCKEKTYEESDDIVDFGEYYFVLPIYHYEEKDGTIVYVYDCSSFGDLDFSGYKNLMQKLGYSIEEAEDGVFAFDGEGKDKFGLGIVKEGTSTYCVIAIMPK